MEHSSSGREAYVALGDSISIDEYAGGPGRGGASLLVRNRDDDFPQWRGRDLASTRPELGFRLLATDGGTTDTLLDVQLPRLAAERLSPRLATLTIGGNDLLLAYGDTRTALAVVRTVRQRVASVTRLLSDMGCRVIVGTVYDPSDGTGAADRAGLPPWPDAVAVLAELNQALREVAKDHGAAVADLHARFLGHGLTRGDVRQLDPRPADRELWYHQVIEPNAWGASAVRGAFWDALNDGATSST
jgi:lysophospholipase L1-like esterase